MNISLTSKTHVVVVFIVIIAPVLAKTRPSVSDVSDSREVPVPFARDDELTNSKAEMIAPYFDKPASMRINQLKPAGSFLRLRCLAMGNPTPNITWLKDGLPIERLLGKVKYKGNYSLDMDDLTTYDNGNYMCIVCNVVGCANFTYRVLILERPRTKPIIQSGSPYNETTVVGGTANFSCPLMYKAVEPFVKWVRNYTNCTNSNATQNLDENLSNLEWLQIKNVTHESEGWYTCIASNSLGITCASAYLEVVDSLEEATPRTSGQGLGS